jgi:hypothetical protein
VPDVVKAKLYPGISPVNSFRVLFNAYFGADYRLLPDRNYYSNYATPYEYTVVEDSNPGCISPDQ